ncbi:uroporphyrinogen-III synthase [Roseinatronobacter alkalisoli]|uniref:Uroporphyrinogen-III synthase n=1 Tax=Roseinatronobacter alkalisoli TaxID=3028235 RepID=A0ABT5TAK5_9RHOB|nr:uroporphyrinogen-III synthase [Roseinatronobacter sp. HJB301]MDD7971431.1 uroporphyrinogen-III synthase [Roseinatronobacter sp. HJB301]
MTATLLLTRPEQAAQDFAQLVMAAGWRWPVVIAPLMQISHCAPDMDALAGAGTLVFTSRHGVAAWRAAGGGCELPVWCVGPRTAQAARQAGFAQVHQAPGGDAVSLRAALLAARPVPPVLHLRGDHTAMVLAAELVKAGIPARDAVLYRQHARALSDAARTLLSHPVPVVVPLFSPRSARLFAAELANLPVPHRAALHVIAISQACAGALGATKCAGIHVAARPDADAMRDAVITLQAELEEGDKPR